jgi:hypothetical protein
MADSRRTKVKNGAGQIEADSTRTLRSRGDKQMLHGREVRRRKISP